jgi:TusA-related sulfurtransferase
MIFSKEETKNLLGMLRSSDNENAVVAFEALKGVDTEKYLGELIVLYKYGKRSIKEWEVACPGCEIAIRNAVTKFTKEEGAELSTGSCLSAMTEGKASNESIELFMELFTENMISFLGQLGYPAEKFEISIKLKEND